MVAAFESLSPILGLVDAGAFGESYEISELAVNIVNSGFYDDPSASTTSTLFQANAGDF